ncbi:PA14 domain-containing protein [Verrucomicrobia bacterium]|nr:PA14 domain-containing protein [Verrucomicrobiota bacterium]
MSAGDTAQTVSFTLPTVDVHYGDSPIDVKASATSNNPVFIFVSGPAYVDRNGKVAITGTGTVNIAGLVLGNATYAQAWHVDNITIKKKALTVTAESKTKVYGDENPTLTIAYDGLVNGDTSASLSLLPAITTTAKTDSNAGSYPITFTTNAVDSELNYSIQHVVGTMTITKVPLTIAALNQNRTYGDENPDTGSVNGLRLRQYNDISGTDVSDLTSNSKYPAGFDNQAVADFFEWPQAGDINTKPGNIGDNYGIELAGYITPTETAQYQFWISADDGAELWLSTDDDQANLVKIASESEWNGVRDYPTTDRRGNADKYSVTVTASSTHATTNLVAAIETAATAVAAATPADTAAKAELAARKAVSDASNATYTALQAIADEVDPTQANVDDAAAKATAAATAATNLTNSKNVETTAKTALTEAGAADTNALNVLVAKTDEYYAALRGGDATVIAAALTAYQTAVTAWEATSAAVSTAKTNLESALSDVASKQSIKTAADTASEAAQKLITDTAATAEEIKAAADAKVIYDADAAVTATAETAAGTAAATLASAQTAYDAAINAALASIAKEIADDINAKTANSNKVIASVKGSEIKIKATESNTAITVDSSAGNGGSDTGLSATTELNYVSNDLTAQISTIKLSGRVETGDSITVNIVGERKENSSPFISLTAGQSYYVKGIMKEGGGGDNFAVTWVKKGADAPAADALPIPGSVLTPASSIDYEYTGFIAGENSSNLTKSPSGIINITETTPVGDYDITIGGAESPNYVITHTNAKVTIGPATLTVTGDNKEIFETEDLPALTYSYSGFLNGDTASTNIVTTASSVATAADKLTPGDYPIVVAGGVAVNYTLKHVNGVMKIKTVTKPKVTGLEVSTNNPLEGDTVTFTVTATGDLLVYKWYKGSELVQTGGNTYTINNVSVSDSSRIQVFAENFKGKSRKLNSLKVKERLNQVFLVVGENSKPVQGANSIKIREYHDISGSEISGLTSSSKYPDSPDAVKSATNFESETNIRDNYGIEASGFLHPTKTGDYTFYIASDDNSEVWLSTDEDPANAVKIAQETSWRGVRDYDQAGDADGGEAKSAKIALEAGKKYSIKVLMKEGGGGDNMALAWSFGDEAAPADGGDPIGGAFLSQNGTNDNHPDYVKDAELKKVLEGQGYEVLFVGPSYPVNSAIDPNNAAFVVVSSTANSTTVAGYTNTTAPLINLAPDLQDDLGFIGKAPNDTLIDQLTGQLGSISSINITNPTHPLAAGLAAGTQQVVGDPVLADLSSAGDTVIPSTAGTTASPEGEQAANAIDNNNATKYLNFDGKNNTASGLTVRTANGGIARGLTITSANDAPERDPATFIISGSNDNTTFTEIASGSVPAFSARFETKSVSFANKIAYKDYKISFPTTATSNGCCMQVAEIEILGYPASAGTEIDANWGTPNDNAIVVANLGGDNDKAAIYAYDIGSIMGNGTAATGRRVNLHTSTDGIGSASATGLALINAAASWVMQFDVLASGGNLNISEGESLVLDGRVNGENISVQWYKDGVAIAGGSTLSLGALDKSKAGTYTIKATDADAAWANRYKEVSYVVSVGGKEAVLVTGSNGLSAAEEKIKNKLTAKGYRVIESAAGSTTPTSVAGKSLVVISPSASALGEVVYNNSGSTEGTYYATTKEFGDQIELGLSNRFIDSLSFEYYGDFTADGDETAVARIYANDGGRGNPSSTSHNGYGSLPGTLLYESEPFAIASGFNSATISGLLVEAPESITWTVDFDGVGNSVGNRAGLIFYNPPAIGSSFDDFVLKSNSTEVLYETDNGVLYEAYYKAGTEFGDQIKLTSVGPSYDIKFEAYAELANAPTEGKAIFRVYANDGADAVGNNGGKRPSSLLYTSSAIALKEGYNTYQILDVRVDLQSDITWTVEFVGVTGGKDDAGNKAALILAGTDLSGSSNDDFWQKDSSGWDLYQAANATQSNDFAIELVAHTGTSKNVVYNATKDTIYEAYFKTGTEFGDEVVLSDTSSSTELSFEVYAELTNAPATGTAKLRIYANDGAEAIIGGGDPTKGPGTLLYESSVINLLEGYNTYTVSGITADLPRNITWTVEFGGVTGNQLNSGNNAALILGGTDVIGTSHDDFWQKDSSGWTIYRSSDSKQDNDFSARVIAHTGGNNGWSYYQSSNAETVNNFGARLTAGVNSDFLSSVDVPMIVFGSDFQSNVKYTGVGSTDSGVEGGSKIRITNTDHSLAAGFTGNVNLVVLGRGDADIGWGVPQGDAIVVATLNGDSSKATIYGYEEGGALANGISAPERRSFVGLTDELFSKLDGDSTRLITAAIEWTGGTGFITKPGNGELLAGESLILTANGYGPGDLVYQWEKDGTTLTNQLSATLTLGAVDKSDAGTYSVVVTSVGGETAQTSAAVKVFDLPTIDFRSPGDGAITTTITHQVKIWALGGVDKLDIGSAIVSINGTDVTSKTKITSNVRGVQFGLDLVENTTDASGDFLGIENLTASANKDMNLRLSYKAGGSARIFSNSWTYKLYDSSNTGSSDIAKMAIHQIYESDDSMYVVWPGSEGFVLERNSDCKGGIWETLPNTIGRGLHIEHNCGTKAFFRLVRVKE